MTWRVNKQAKPKRRGYGLLVSLLLLVIVGLSPLVMADDLSRERELRCVFLYKILYYVEWPDSSEEDIASDSTISIAVVGDKKMFDALQDISSKKIRRQEIEVVQAQEDDDLSGFDIVYLATDETEDLQKTAEDLAGLPTLTVSDGPGSTEAGVMVNFISVETAKGKKIRFEVNDASLDRSGIKIGAQLMKLAANKAGPEQ